MEPKPPHTFDTFRLEPRPGGLLLTLGRLCPESREAMGAHVVSTRQACCTDRGQDMHDGMLSPSIPRRLHQYRQGTPVLCVRLCPTRACITGSRVCVGRVC
jgi:hypothetical protein